MELVEGESYLILGAAKEGQGHDYIRVSILSVCIDLFMPLYGLLYELCIAAAGTGPHSQLHLHEE